jgi:hypothetical protein
MIGNMDNIAFLHSGHHADYRLSSMSYFVSALFLSFRIVYINGIYDTILFLSVLPATSEFSNSSNTLFQSLKSLDSRLISSMVTNKHVIFLSKTFRSFVRMTWFLQTLI